MLLGVSGMLGLSIFRYLSRENDYVMIATSRSNDVLAFLNDDMRKHIFTNLDATRIDDFSRLIHDFKPDLVINCIGITKQKLNNQPNFKLSLINSTFPHSIAKICSSIDAQFLQFSTDCVFSGKRGEYVETDIPDPSDIYGASKWLGEVVYGNHLSIRTSIIGHSIGEKVSLVDWFLGSTETIFGYENAIFSGLPTVCVAEFIEKYIINNNVKGLVHLGAKPIDKYSLLTMLKNIYDVDINIKKSSKVFINRSLKPTFVLEELGYKPESWSVMLDKMHCEYQNYFSTSL
jgi:dTDP-4-dehydrorhamnose reductase